MILTALFLAESLTKPVPAYGQDDLWSIKAKKAFIVYGMCLGSAAFDQREKPGSAEARLMSAKAAYRKQYDTVVEAMVEDASGKVAPATAAAKARAILDETDGRVFPMLGPAPPPNLADLPVRNMVGEWLIGRGSMATGLTIQFTDKPSLIGTFASGNAITSVMDQAALRTWEIFKDERGRASFRATFVDGRVASFEQIPSPAGEMNFINEADPAVQRYDVLIEDEDLLVRWVAKDSSGQLRFYRNVKTGRERQPE